MPRQRSVSRRYKGETDLSLSLLPKQLQLLNSDASVAALIGGYGSGKSYGGAAKALQLCIENEGLDGMIVAPSYKMLARVTLPTFLEMAKPLILQHHRQDARIDLCNGSRIWYGSADNPGSLEGSNLAWFWLDEGRLVSSVAYNIMLGRLRVGAAKRLQGVVTSTPTSGGWLEREFAVKKPGRECIHCSSRDNTYLAADYIDTLMETYSEAQVRVYIDGEWAKYEGLVYPEFDVRQNVIVYEPRKEWPLVAGVDFGYRYPACVVGQIVRDEIRTPSYCVPEGSLVIFAEEVPNGMSTEALGERIGRRFGEYSWDFMACDPAGATTSSTASEHGGIMDIQALRNGLIAGGLEGVPIRYVHGANSRIVRSIHTGIEAVRGCLRNARGTSTLYFSDELLKSPSDRGVIRGLKSFQYRDGCQIPLRGQPANQVDHVMDALRYLVRHLRMSGASVIRTA
jgi:hypothetical protein